jgi:hypothetical protein
MMGRARFPLVERSAIPMQVGDEKARPGPAGRNRGANRSHANGPARHRISIQPLTAVTFPM